MYKRPWSLRRLGSEWQTSDQLNGSAAFQSGGFYKWKKKDCESNFKIQRTDWKLTARPKLSCKSKISIWCWAPAPALTCGPDWTKGQDHEHKVMRCRHSMEEWAAQTQGQIPNHITSTCLLQWSWMTKAKLIRNCCIVLSLFLLLF